MDLWLIIREYWDEDFKEIIGGEGKKSFYTRLEIVHRIRNKIMHSKPVMSHELRELKNFREYFNYILSKTGKDYSQFISYFPINDVLSNFKKELEQHKENYRNKSSENHFCSDVFDRSAVEWWWDSTLFSDYSLELTKYYDDVNEVNKSISDFENGIGKKFSIDSDIFSFKLPERCDSLLAKIQPHS